MSYAERLHVIDHDNIMSRHLILSLSMFYNVFKKFVSCNVLDSFISPTYMHSFNLRRSEHYLFLPFCKSSSRKSFFTYRLIPIWNSLPHNVVTTNITKTFMNKLKTLDMLQPYRTP